MRKLTNKELFDIRTMRYFIPRFAPKGWRITQKDKVAMADLSSKGIQPKGIGLTDPFTGVRALVTGKTYRDLMVTEWSDSVRKGYMTKWELINSVPEWLQPWLEEKLKDVPYDEDAYEDVGTLEEPHFVLTGRGARPFLVNAYRQDTAKHATN